MGRNRSTDAIGWCGECQKLLYTDRKRAKVIGRQHHPRKGSYPCPINPLMFHVGSLAEAIRQGHVTRNEYYGGDAA
jgi:hypothetical protein